MNNNIWPEVRLRNILGSHLNPVRRQALANATQVSFLPMEAIGERGELNLTLTRDKEDVSSGYTLFFDEDVLVAKITPCFENGKGAIARGLLNGVGFGTTELHVLSPSKYLDTDFLYYITASHLFRALGEAYMTGAAGQKRVPREFVENFRIRLPPLPTQRTIAAYLDRETARIDAMIVAKKQAMALLAEKRLALITHAVTRGINPHVPMKDSGVEWIGEVPENWSVSLSRRFIRNIEQGWSPIAEERIAGADEWAVIKLSAVKNGRFFAKEHKALPASYDIPAHLEIRSGDFLLSRANTPLLVGDVCVVGKTRSRLIFSDLVYRVVLEPDYIDADYLKYFLLSPAGRAQIETQARGSSQSMVKISQNHIQEWIIPLPPLAEQHAIIRFLDESVGQIEQLQVTAERTINLLQDRRAALISEAVTGQFQIAE